MRGFLAALGRLMKFCDLNQSRHTNSHLPVLVLVVDVGQSAQMQGYWRLHSAALLATVLSDRVLRAELVEQPFGREPP